MLKQPPARANTVIAGRHAGKAITITPQAEPIWNELVKLSSAGNYWAQLTVRGIEQLAAGRLSQNNIFVQPGTVQRGGTDEFVILLPGCRVTAEKLPNDTYNLVHFQADLNYAQLIAGGGAEEVPGLYRAGKDRDGWGVKPRKDGRIEAEKNRVVAISDSGYIDPADAADKVAPTVVEAPVSNGGVSLDCDGFDLHFTPGKGRIGGLKNYRNAISPLNDDRLKASAQRLAQTIYEARDLPHVRWISEFGGSGVLTQALHILAQRKVTLKNHYVFLVRPTTSPLVAIQAAHAVEGLKLDRKFSKTGMLDYIGNREQLEMILARRRHEEKTYTRLHAATDAVLTGKSLHGAVGFVAGAAGLAGLTITAPAAGAFLTALGGIAGKMLTAGAAGSAALESWMPRQYNRIKGKF